MFLRHVVLSNFRNYAQLDLEPARGLNVYLGANGQGKSNLLEAVAMLGTGKSFRTSREGEVVRSGMELGAVRGEAVVRAGAVELSCAIERSVRGTRKSYAINGSGVLNSTANARNPLLRGFPSFVAVSIGPALCTLESSATCIVCLIIGTIPP